jgi:ARP2/3 complex ARPC3 (21 kDa) subunit
MSKRDAEKAVMNVALDTNFAIPGDAGFPLNQAFEAPRERNEAEVLRQYIMQMRQELASRLLNRVYPDETNTPSKVSSMRNLINICECKLIIFFIVVVKFCEEEIYEQVSVRIESKGVVPM